MKRIITLLLLLFSIVYSQDKYSNLSNDELLKINPVFLQELGYYKKGQVPEKLAEAAIIKNKNGTKLYDVIISTTDGNKIKRTGVSINSVVPGYATARITLKQIMELAKKDFVKAISPPEILYPQNDVAGALVGADLVKNGYINSTSYDGTGVIVLVIDTGIDWTHEDFQIAGTPNTSRILYIWDQTDSRDTNTPEDNHGAAFSGLNYGVEYSQSQINDEIDGTPAGVVLEQDTDGHGTHVAGTACGNGNALSTNKFQGIASDADIVVVKAGNGSFTSTNIVNALKYAKEIANETGKAVVVNMSIGGHANPHDGSSAEDSAVDDFTSSGNGRVAVISAGNSGSDLIHISGSVNAGGYGFIRLDVPSRTSDATANNEYFIFDLYWNNSDDVTATILTPNSLSYTRTANTAGTSQTSDGTLYLYNYVGSNGKRRNYAYIYDAVVGQEPSSGIWYLRVLNNSSNTMTYHAWLAANTIHTSLVNGDSDYTIGAPGDATSAITVGSYVSRWRWTTSSGAAVSYSGTDITDDISTFSSIGPRVDGVQKPDITAPGQGIVSSTSANYTPSSTKIITAGKYHLNQGTSMSSPVVAGAVALLLDYNSAYTASEIKSLITSNADTDSETGNSLPDYTWGYGKLNIFKAMASAINSVSVSMEMIAQQDFQYGVVNFPASGSDYWYSEKFTPSISGKVSSVLFHPGSGSSLAGDLPIEIWDDNSGNPNSKLGSTVTFDSDALLPYSWNKLYFASGGVSVTAGTAYHVVIKTPASSTFNLAQGGSTTSSKFSSNDGATWSAASDDFCIRPIISTSESATPVELTTFTANLFDNTVRLNWQTATEVNNYGFEVQRKIDKVQSNWTDLGFVQGHGNSNSPKDYSFTDENPPGGEVQYRLKQIDMDGSYEYSDVAEVNVGMPKKYELANNYPNPFNPTTTINYSIPSVIARSPYAVGATKQSNKQPSHQQIVHRTLRASPRQGVVRNDVVNVTLKVYDILGREVATLVNEKQAAGNYSVQFNASKLSSGVYFYKLQSGDFTQIRKMILMK